MTIVSLFVSNLCEYISSAEQLMGPIDFHSR